MVSCETLNMFQKFVAQDFVRHATLLVGARLTIAQKRCHSRRCHAGNAGGGTQRFRFYLAQFLADFS